MSESARESIQHSLSRTKRGFAIRDDLVKTIKHIAVEDDRPLYAVMEEALEQYVARWRARQNRGR